MRKDEEYQICKAISTYLKLQYPRVIFHFDYAGNNMSKVQSARMKGIQGKRGWPDLFIAKPKTGRTTWPIIFCGLFIEIKKEGTKIIYLRDGHTLVSDPHIREQAEMLVELRKQGYAAHFGVGFDECKKIIDDYLKN